MSLSGEQIIDLARQFQASRVLLTACELDVFSTLRSDALTSEELASRLGTDPRATDRLLNALVALGVLEKSGSTYTNTAASAKHLDRASAHFFAAVDHANHLWDSWGTLTEAVRRGTSVSLPDVNERGPKWLEAFIAAMHSIATPRADRIVGLLDLSGVRSVLDVGGGSGAYSMAFARTSENIQSTVFDLPNVLPITRKYVDSAGMSSRVNFVEGDLLKDELPTGFDLVFLSAIIHSNSPQEIRELFAKCALSLNPGGQLVVQEFVPDEDRCGPPPAILFALNMLVNTPAGDTYTESEIRGWMQEAGFVDFRRRDTPDGTTLLTGRKPTA